MRFDNDRCDRMRSFAKRFAQDEEGGVIIMTLVLLVTMLVLGGMAVDFMRFENERAQLQSVSDRAVLAAASLDQDLDSKEVVEDFFEKAGYGENIIGEPDASDVNGTRSVSVDSAIDVNTFYLRLIGIDELTAPAQSAAVEGTGNIEISLILDISGSMGSRVASEDNKTRMQLLQAAAKDFVDDILLPEYRNQISINLITYSDQVRIGNDLFNALTTTPKVFQDVNGLGEVVATHTNNTPCIQFEPILPPNWASTGDLPMGDFGTLEFDTDRTWVQLADASWSGNSSTICPSNADSAIIPLSQNADELKDAIDALAPTRTTAIHIGMKWGVSLLDPSMRELLEDVASVDEAFQGVRPSEYGGGSNTIKYVILMTDGQNVTGWRPRPNVLDTAAERNRLADHGARNWSGNSARYWPHNSSNQDTWLQSLCDLAKEKMTVYTIAMGAPPHGTGVMKRCASTEANAFSTDFSSEDSRGIDEIFETIAQQITALRLNL